MSDIDERIAALELHEEARRFFNTQIGKYVLGVSDQEVQAALEEIKTCDPEDSKNIRKLQFRIAVAEAAITWMGEAIAAGQQVLQIISEEERDYGSE